MIYIFRGIGLVYGSGRYWKYIIVPWLVGVAALLVVAALSYWLIVPRVDALIPTNWSESFGGPLRALVALSFLFIFILISGSLYLIFVSLFSSTMWEKLSFEVEKTTTGRELSHGFTVGQIVRDSLGRGAFALAISLAALCCGSPLFGIPAVLLAGWIGVFDYTASAFSRRGILLGPQFSAVGKLRYRFSFLLGAGILTLVPVVNVLLLPALVAGGTLMVIESEKR